MTAMGGRSSIVKILALFSRFVNRVGFDYRLKHDYGISGTLWYLGCRGLARGGCTRGQAQRCGKEVRKIRGERTEYTPFNRG